MNPAELLGSARGMAAGCAIPPPARVAPRPSGVRFPLMLPPLLIYFSTLGLARRAMTQALNACFLVGKVTQATAFAVSGQFTTEGLLLTLPICVVALLGYWGGRRLAPRISPEAYGKTIRG